VITTRFECNRERALDFRFAILLLAADTAR
jgi:hypothetical protein